VKEGPEKKGHVHEEGSISNEIEKDHCKKKGSSLYSERGGTMDYTRVSSLGEEYRNQVLREVGDGKNLVLKVSRTMQ